MLRLVAELNPFSHGDFLVSNLHQHVIGSEHFYEEKTPTGRESGPAPYKYTRHGKKPGDTACKAEGPVISFRGL